MIYAGIVTFEPDIERLRENIAAISTQVDSVIVFDNGSSNATAVRNEVSKLTTAEVVGSDVNRGIAAALNAIARLARDRGASWLVTLDQDSVAPVGLVAELEAVSRERPQAALIAPFIVDRNKTSATEYETLKLPRFELFKQAARKGAITSGALTSLDRLAEVGWFDDGFFIDYVDYDLNQRLLDARYEIVRANHTYLLHEVGRARKTWLWVPRRDISGSWKFERFYSFGHSSTRCYYKARNRVLFSRKYGRRTFFSNQGVMQIPQQVVLTVLFEDQRAEKLRAFVRGFRDGLRMKV